MSETNGTAGRSFWQKRSVWVGGAVLGCLALLGAFAAPRAWAFREAGQGAMHGFGRQHFGASMRDPEAVKQHAGLALEWMLRGVDASQEQQQQARRVADRLIDEIAPLAQQHRAHHEAIVRELGKPQIDREALDGLRRQELALADTASTKAVSAIADLAEVLTPEQRREILEMAERFHGGPASN